MAGCCDRTGLCRMFNEKRAEADARTYRRKGLEGEARRIVDFLVARGIAGRSVLEIGGGVGAIQIELLKAGADSAVGVEISPAYERVAHDLATEHAVADRVRRRVADFARENADISAADAVVMHKVVCCYPDMPALVRPAAERARRWLLMTFPAPRWWIRAGLGLVNMTQAITRSSYRAFAHGPDEIEAVAASAGLRRALFRRGIVWNLLAMERA